MITSSLQLKSLFQGFFSSRTTSSAAAISFFTALSITPIIILLLKFASILNVTLKTKLLNEATLLMGPDVAQTLFIIISKNQKISTDKFFSSWAGYFVLVISASFVFNQLEVILNDIFSTKKNPQVKQSMMRFTLVWFKQKCFDGLVALLFIFMLILFLILSSIFFKFLIIFDKTTLLFLNGFLAFLFYTVLFSFLFLLVPREKIPWRIALQGGVFTSLLFVLGTHFIGLYISNGIISGIYGVFGSFLFFLLWVYYSAIIIIFGAHLCRVLRENQIL